MKGILDLSHPWTGLRSHIESYANICYLSYAILSYLGFIPQKRRESMDLKLLKHLRQDTRVYRRDEKSGFSWESIVNLSGMQKRMVDAEFKKT